MSFWSSVDLTGNQTASFACWANDAFWSSVDLTGNQTRERERVDTRTFWSSVDLTGNQTGGYSLGKDSRFGAVSI